MKKQKFKYYNRDISWLRFNHRVLQEMEDQRNPLMERLKFAAIFSSNLDEFFEVRGFKLLTCCIILYSACILSSCRMENKISVQDKFEESAMHKTEKASGSDDKEIKRLYNPEDFEKVTLSKKLLEISGLTFDPVSNELYTVNDEKAIIFKINNEGEILSKIDFGKNADYEGIEKVGNHIFILKSNGKIAEYDLVQSKIVDIYDNPLTLTNDTEGLGYNRSTHSLLIACKGSPNFGDAPKLKKTKAVYAFDIETKKLKTDPVIKISDDAIENYMDRVMSVKQSKKKYKKRLHRAKEFSPSAIAHNMIDDRYYLLSTLGKVLLVVNNKSEIETMYFLEDSAYIQPEGLCFDKDGNMYISNEGKGHKSNILKIAKLN